MASSVEYGITHTQVEKSAGMDEKGKQLWDNPHTSGKKSGDWVKFVVFEG